VRTRFGWSVEPPGGDAWAFDAAPGVLPVVDGWIGDGNTTRGTADEPGTCNATGCSSRDTSRSSPRFPLERSWIRVDLCSAGTILLGEYRR
jgi:hypothetical protein